MTTSNTSSKRPSNLKQIIVIGNGGRENSLAWALKKGSSVEQVWVAPGNGGTNSHTGCNQLDIDMNDTKNLIEHCLSLKIDLVIIGPEDPLEKGLADELRSAGIPVFGPGRSGAKIESSKSWAKDLMNKAGIPTAKHWSVKSEEEAISILNQLDEPPVVKADGLAAGKGVTVSKDIKEAKQAIKDCFKGKFGASGKHLLLEEKLNGPEVSIFALCDGERMLILPPVQDHKRLEEGDKGPNTGGMGAYAPAALLNEQELDDVKEKILIPTLNELKSRGIDYRGVIYAGLMITKEGPKVIEFNCRFGDPECQTLMPLMGSEIGEILHACALGKLNTAPKLRISSKCCACVVTASHGYPNSPRKGDLIKIAIESNNSTQIFHSGTTRNPDGELITAGGRVLSIVSQANNFDDSFNSAYKTIQCINYAGMIFRNDIGHQVRST